MAPIDYMAKVDTVKVAIIKSLLDIERIHRIELEGWVNNDSSLAHLYLRNLSAIVFGTVLNVTQQDNNVTVVPSEHLANQRNWGLQVAFLQRLMDIANLPKRYLALGKPYDVPPSIISLISFEILWLSEELKHLIQNSTLMGSIIGHIGLLESILNS
mmetsp:Transcript_11780/g.13573  ORF Transcript_11780/g.13573 Transcript_11780/m.13573 type:complete len:157 (+) Transcript_11780:737-1207(+)